MDFRKIIQYFDGKASPEEAIAVDDWVKKSEANSIYFENLHQSWLAAGNEIYYNPDVLKEWGKFIQISGVTKLPEPDRKKVAARRNISGWGIAAGLLLLCGIAGYRYYNPAVSHAVSADVIFNAGTGKKQTILPDSSIVLSYPQSRLRYEKENFKQQRYVELEGNAFFNIKHQPDCTFIIRMDSLFVKDIGTSFEILQTSDSITVNVISGEAAFYNVKDTLVLTAGEAGIYKKHNAVFVTSRKEKKGTFLFNDMLLGDVVAELSAYFKTEVRFENSMLAQCRLSAGLKDKTLGEIMDIIDVTLGIRHKINAKEITLSGNGCE